MASLWSGLSSRASLLDNLAKVTVPTAVVSYRGDNAIHPHMAQATYDRCAAADKKLFSIDADHFGFRLASNPNEGGREAAGKILVDWLRNRSPAA